MRLIRTVTGCSWLLSASLVTFVSAQTAKPSLIIRTDDIGVSHSVNMAMQNYRWGPVAGSAAVPSLVDENGFFFSSSAHVVIDDA